MDPADGNGFAEGRGGAWAFRFGHGFGVGTSQARSDFARRVAAIRGRAFAVRNPFARVLVGILSVLVAIPLFFLLLGIAFVLVTLVLALAALGLAFGLVRAIVRAFGVGSRGSPPATDDGREGVRVIRRVE